MKDFDELNDAQTIFRSPPADTMDGRETLAKSDPITLANRYRILRKIGEGGMGSVWLAEDLKLDQRQVAIKMLPAVMALNRRAIQQMKAEAKVAMQLAHPHIVTLRSFESADEGAFLVMDYVHGQTLDDLLAESGTLTEEEVLRIFRPLATAIDYAHQQRVVHRDIKPSNIVLREGDNHPFIMDFGIAREMKDSLTRITGHGSAGTLPYMSPEQLHGDAPAPPQDIYGLSSTLYECLSGHPPFHRGPIEHQIETIEPAPLASQSALAHAIMRGLSKDPSRRPLTANALLNPLPKTMPEKPSPPVPPLSAPPHSVSPTQEIKHDRVITGRLVLFWMLYLLFGFGGLIATFSSLLATSEQHNRTLYMPAILAVCIFLPGLYLLWLGLWKLPRNPQELQPYTRWPLPAFLFYIGLITFLSIGSSMLAFHMAEILSFKHGESYLLIGFVAVGTIVYLFGTAPMKYPFKRWTFGVYIIYIGASLGTLFVGALMMMLSNSRLPRMMRFDDSETSIVMTIYLFGMLAYLLRATSSKPYRDWPIAGFTLYNMLAPILCMTCFGFLSSGLHIPPIAALACGLLSICFHWLLPRLRLFVLWPRGRLAGYLSLTLFLTIAGSQIIGFIVRNSRQFSYHYDWTSAGISENQVDPGSFTALVIFLLLILLFGLIAKRITRIHFTPNPRSRHP